MCWEVLPRATYLISGYQTLDELYVDDQGLEKSRLLLEQELSQLYTLVLEYQVIMVIYLSSRIQRLIASFFTASDSPLQSK